jgi:phospholipid/cholesterol/gamma-HCH transport system substrate-binding protein
MPGTNGTGDGFEVKAQLPDVSYLEQNSRVRVGDVNVGTVTRIEREGWHALISMKLNNDVELPANATVKVAQTSLLATLHVELAPPTDTAPEGRLHNGSMIPLESAALAPSTEQALAALSLLLNGGGLGQVQDITQAFSVAFAGREADLRELVNRVDEFTRRLNAQTGDIIAATESLNRLVGQVAQQRPVLDEALRTVPDALKVLSDQRTELVDAIDRFGQFSALTADSVNQTKESLVAELQALGPVLQSLADAGPALTRSLSFLSTYPFPKETIDKWFRGEHANLSLIVDLTLSRLDGAYFTGTRFEGELTQLEMQWGRTVGQIPSPYTAGNPLVVPYRTDQGR